MSHRIVQRLSCISPSRTANVSVIALTAPDGSSDGRLGLWAFEASVRVIGPESIRVEVRTVRGLFTATNLGAARERARALAADKARELGRVLDIDVTRLW